VEENQSMVSRLIQCFHFEGKRGRGNTCFERVKEHVRRLLIPAWRNDWRMCGAMVCGGGRQLESGNVLD
jgi:hypothetical protein